MIVRPMQYDDVPAIVDRFDAVVEHELSLGSALMEPNPTQRKKGAFKAIASGYDNGSALCLVGEVDGEVKAFVYGTLFQQFEFCKHNRNMYIFAAKIDEDLPPMTRAVILRRGAQLLRVWAKEKGATSIWANVFHANEKSRKMLRLLGMKAQYLRYEGEI